MFNQIRLHVLHPPQEALQPRVSSHTSEEQNLGEEGTKSSISTVSAAVAGAIYSTAEADATQVSKIFVHRSRSCEGFGGR